VSLGNSPPQEDEAGEPPPVWHAPPASRGKQLSPALSPSHWACIQQIVANAAAASKTAEEVKAARAAAPGLLGDYRALGFVSLSPSMRNLKSSWRQARQKSL
jgi:hypothetical protein